jgi:hypothetical protein
VCGRTGHPVATTPGPYRAEHLAYLVERADTGHYQTVTQTTVDLDDIALAHRACGRHRLRARRRRRPHPHTHSEGAPVMIEARAVTRRYGDTTAVDTAATPARGGWPGPRLPTVVGPGPRPRGDHGNDEADDVQLPDAAGPEHVRDLPAARGPRTLLPPPRCSTP